MRSQCVSVSESLTGYDHLVPSHQCHDVLKLAIGEHAHVYMLHYQGLGTNILQSVQINN